MDTVVAAENLMYRFYHGRIFMHCIDHFHIGIFFHQTLHGTADIFQGLAEVFPSMGGHGDDAFVFKINLIEFGDSKCIVLLDGMRQCVDDGIACDENAVRTDVFLQQMLLCQRGGCKMQIGQCAGEAAVHFLGEGLIFIIGAQACLDMTDLHLIIICRQCACEGGRGIPMDEDDIGFFLTHDLLQTG